MHSFTGPSGTIFHFNGDFSGDVKVVVTDTKETVEHVPAEYGAPARVVVEVPSVDLLALVADCYVQPKRVEALEQASWQDLLGAGCPEGPPPNSHMSRIDETLKRVWDALATAPAKGTPASLEAVRLLTAVVEDLVEEVKAGLRGHGGRT